MPGADSYARAARAKHAPTGRRDDARQLASIVHRADTGGVRRDYLRGLFPGWPEVRWRQALFYAYGLGWIDLLGWQYVVAPPANFPLRALGGTTGAAPSTPITATSSGGNNSNDHQLWK